MKMKRTFFSMMCMWLAIQYWSNVKGKHVEKHTILCYAQLSKSRQGKKNSTVFVSKLGVDHGNILCTDPPPLKENPEGRGVCTQGIMGATKEKTTLIGKVCFSCFFHFSVKASAIMREHWFINWSDFESETWFLLFTFSDPFWPFRGNPLLNIGQNFSELQEVVWCLYIYSTGRALVLHKDHETIHSPLFFRMIVRIERYQYGGPFWFHV